MPEALKAAAPAPLAVQRSFAVEMRHAVDAALRVLNPFAVAGADIVSLHMDRRADRLAIRIVVEDLDERCAETLRRRLEGLPGVIAVGAGWRTMAG